MKRMFPLLAASALIAAPAAAQHAGHSMPGMTMPGTTMPMPSKPAAKKKPAATKRAARKMKRQGAPKKAAIRKAPAKKVPPKRAAHPQAAHDMSSMPGMQMPAQPGEAHAGHQMPAQPGDQHAGHAMGAMTAEVPVAPPPPEALQGPENAGDSAWGRAAMDRGRSVLFTEHGGMTAHKLLFDQAEMRLRGGGNGYFVNAQGWVGGDIDKLWLKTEVEGVFGARPDQAEFQALWSHAISPWFDLQTGVRLDTRPDRRGRLVAGVQGLAPYWIEVEAAAFLSDRGDVTARFEAEHDVRITQRLILQPRAQLDFSMQDMPAENIGSGLSKAELGLRLRYEVMPNFAPYAGLAYESAFGGTRHLLRSRGHDPNSPNLVVGLRTWF